jgi:hypothetical protein
VTAAHRAGIAIHEQTLLVEALEPIRDTRDGYVDSTGKL